MKFTTSEIVSWWLLKVVLSHSTICVSILGHSGGGGGNPGVPPSPVLDEVQIGNTIYKLDKVRNTGIKVIFWLAGKKEY